MTDSASLACEAHAWPLLRVWTDGGCRPNPGFGAWGFLVRTEAGRKIPRTGTEEDTTNNRMEMTAILRAFEAATGPRRFIVHTDSAYLLGGMTRHLPIWKARRGRKANGKPVENWDLWLALDAAASRHQHEWRWVEGHGADVENNEVDALVTAALRRGA